MSVVPESKIWRWVSSVQTQFEVFCVQQGYLQGSLKQLVMEKSSQQIQDITKGRGPETEGLFCLIDKVIVKGVHFV